MPIALRSCWIDSASCVYGVWLGLRRSTEKPPCLPASAMSCLAAGTFFVYASPAASMG